MCCLRGDRRSGDYGEPEIDENGSVAKHEKQEKVKQVGGNTSAAVGLIVNVTQSARIRVTAVAEKRGSR